MVPKLKEPIELATGLCRLEIEILLMSVDGINGVRVNHYQRKDRWYPQVRTTGGIYRDWEFCHYAVIDRNVESRVGYDSINEALRCCIQMLEKKLEENEF